jgi:hypothetical protein
MRRRKDRPHIHVITSKILNKCSHCKSFSFSEHYKLQLLLKNTILCSAVEVHRRFGGMNCLHIQGWRMSQASNKQNTIRKMSGLISWLTYSSTVMLETADPKYLWTSTGLHGIKSQKIVLLLFTAVRTWSPVTTFIFAYLMISLR